MSESIDISTLPRTRSEAKASGSKYYFTGKPCKNGHSSFRYTTGNCYECVYLQNKKYYEENRESDLERSRKWREENREKFREYYYKDHEETKRKQRIYFKNKRDNDPVHKQNQTIHNALNRFIKYGGWSKYFDQFGYTRESLREHFENQFTGEMNWDSHGVTWVIDHVKPKSKCESLEECWALSNLQPLHPSENRYKYNKWKESND